MVSRNRSHSQFRHDSRRGAITLPVLVIFAPVILVMMGFAVDLGRLYLIKGELKAAADAAALAAATRLIGTEQSTADGTTAAQLGVAVANSAGNRYDFGGIRIGDSSGLLSSSVDEVEYFDTMASSTDAADAAGSSVTGAAARYARVTVRADAPLLFFSLLPVAFERRTPIVQRSVAGRSAPVCTACGILPVAIAALDSAETVDFGFVPGTAYTLGFQCTGGINVPAALPGTTARIPYLIINRLDEAATVLPDETTQLFRVGAGGIPPNASQALGCVSVNAVEQIWATAIPSPCTNNNVQPAVRNFFCGVAARFDNVPVGVCENIAEVATAASLYPIDTDLNELADYSAYVGNRRRIVTVAVVDALNTVDGMTVLGFRQFLLQPNASATTLNSADANARVPAIYIGSVVPVAQGRLDGCQITSGPGKLVLHR